MRTKDNVVCLSNRDVESVATNVAQELGYQVLRPKSCTVMMWSLHYLLALESSLFLAFLLPTSCVQKTHLPLSWYMQVFFFKEINKFQGGKPMFPELVGGGGHSLESPEALSDEELEQNVNVWTRKPRRIAV